MKKLIGICVVAGSMLAAQSAYAFCGCFIPPKREVVAGQQSITNQSSKVVLARNDNRTVITVASNYKGKIKEFAMVIPVPTFIEKGQIHLADAELISRVDRFTSPRLTEIQELNPCTNRNWGGAVAMEDSAARKSGGGRLGPAGSGKTLGVTIDAEYAVGEYDITILSATQSDGLEQWLSNNGYAVPKGAGRVFQSYIKQGMRFFVAKVNLEKHSKTGFKFLRPLQIAYESPKFMLPIRLGMINADGPQDLVVIALTRDGRVEPTNYRMVKMPTARQVPAYIKRDFNAFYEATFDRAVSRENMRVVHLEFAGWAQNWPVGTTANGNADGPLTRSELRQLGVFWGSNVYVTRMRVRYEEARFPSDFVFQETSDTTQFSTRFTVRIPWDGSGQQCAATQTYWGGVASRQEQEAQTLARLTGWNINSIRGKLKEPVAAGGNTGNNGKWWENIWDK